MQSDSAIRIDANLDLGKSALNHSILQSIFLLRTCSDQVTLYYEMSFFRKQKSENSGFSTSSKRSKRPAEDMGEQANKKKRENFLIQGKSQNENFSGVARPKARLHVYIGRVNKESDETIIQSHCRNKKMPVMHIREITRDGADYRSFHAVFDMDYKDIIENGDSWPDGVTIGRFRLNENSKSWLKSLPKQTQSSSKDQTGK